MEAAAKVIETAREHAAEFILIAGDLFESNGITRLWVRRVADLLATAGRPVYIIPGNHDALEPGSVWEHPAWRDAAHVHVLREAARLELPGGFLYPCPLRSNRGSLDPTAWIKPEVDTGIRVGLAHGTLGGLTLEENYHPILPGAAQRTGLDYLALGHWHSARIDGRMAYCGTHEPTRFGERDSGNVLLVEIERPGTPPRVSAIPTGVLQWTQIEETIHSHDGLASLADRIARLPDPARTLIEIRLKGFIFAASQTRLAHLEEMLEARFLFARLDSAALRPAPADDTWLEALPRGPVRDAAGLLRMYAAGERGLSKAASPEVAAQALLELYAIASETGGRSEP